MWGNRPTTPQENFCYPKLKGKWKVIESEVGVIDLYTSSFHHLKTFPTTVLVRL